MPPLEYPRQAYQVRYGGEWTAVVLAETIELAESTMDDVLVELGLPTDATVFGVLSEPEFRRYRGLVLDDEADTMELAQAVLAGQEDR